MKYGKIASQPKYKILGLFKDNEDVVVKITFEKLDSDVLITDFVKYSFLLNNEYIPNNLVDANKFYQFMIKKNVTKEDLLAYVRRDKYAPFRTDEKFKKVNLKVNNSFEKILHLDSNCLQGIIWDIKLNEVIKIEFIERNKCSKRRIVRDFRKEYISKLK